MSVPRAVVLGRQPQGGAQGASSLLPDVRATLSAPVAEPHKVPGRVSVARSTATAAAAAARRSFSGQKHFLMPRAPTWQVWGWAQPLQGVDAVAKGSSHGSSRWGSGDPCGVGLEEGWGQRLAGSRSGLREGARAARSRLPGG